jgi:hypothetical protein
VIAITGDAGHHSIAVHGRPGILGGDKDVVSIAFAREKAVAGLANPQPAGDEIGLLRQDVTIRADAGDLAGVFQIAQRLPDLAPVVTAQAKRASQFLAVERTILWPAEEGEDSGFEIGFGGHFARIIEESSAIESGSFRPGADSRISFGLC